jgi:hypothetical protein
MDKKRLEIIITSLLILVLIFVWINTAKVLSKKSKHKAKALAVSYPADKETPSTGLGQKKITPIIKENIWPEKEDIDFLRSPFSGKKYGEEQPPDFKISGIMWDETNPQVIINGKISKAGDSIEGFIIEKIERNKVILFNARKRIELNI